MRRIQRSSVTKPACGTTTQRHVHSPIGARNYVLIVSPVSTTFAGTSAGTSPDTFVAAHETRATSGVASKEMILTGVRLLDLTGCSNPRRSRRPASRRSIPNLRLPTGRDSG
jgi:hypothetical protein